MLKIKRLMSNIELKMKRLMSNIELKMKRPRSGPYMDLTRPMIVLLRALPSEQRPVRCMSSVTFTYGSTFIQHNAGRVVRMPAARYRICISGKAYS
jgi:hypothetical protein